MLIDITLKVTPEMLNTAWKNTDKSLVGHLGTHFDAMNKEFPLEYTIRRAVVFDVSGVRGRDIDLTDVNIELVKRDMLVAFYTGFIHEVEYGTVQYFKMHPQLSHELINALIDKGISIIGIDAPGIRRGSEHVEADRRCADNGAFVVENLCGLKEVLSISNTFTARTYPLNIEGITGLPCRVVAEL